LFGGGTGSDGGENAAFPGIDFLEAVYTQQDPRRAAQPICSESATRTSSRRRSTRSGNSVPGYRNPRFSSDDPGVEDESSDGVRVSAKIILTTSDDQTAEQELSLTVVRKTSW
jgi:hypothetical protein